VRTHHYELNQTHRHVFYFSPTRLIPVRKGGFGEGRSGIEVRSCHRKNYSESLMGTHSCTVIKAFVLYPFPAWLNWQQPVVQPGCDGHSHSCTVRLKCAITKPNFIGLNNYKLPATPSPCCPNPLLLHWL